MFPHVFHAVAAEDCGFWVVESASGQAWQVDPAEVHDLRISMRHRRNQRACTYAHISMHGKGWTGAHVPETAVLATEAFSGLLSLPNSSVAPAPSSSFQMNMIMIRS